MSRLRHHSPPLRICETADTTSASEQFSLAKVLPLAMLLLFSAIFASGQQPSAIFQPTVVGILWAGVFLAGYLAGGAGRGRCATLLLASPLGYLSWQAFISLTDLAAAENLLLVAILLSGGWASSGLTVSSGSDTSRRLPSQLWQGRFFIWDIGFATTLAACVVHAVPRLQIPSPLQFAVAACLVAGLLCSWLACVWVWNDNWHRWSLLALIAALAAGAGCLYLGAPTGLSLGSLLQWGLAGPINVIAAQATVVLAMLTIWRWEVDRLRPPCQPTPPETSRLTPVSPQPF